MATHPRPNRTWLLSLIFSWFSLTRSASPAFSCVSRLDSSRSTRISFSSSRVLRQRRPATEQAGGREGRQGQRQQDRLATAQPAARWRLLH